MVGMIMAEELLTMALLELLSALLELDAGLELELGMIVELLEDFGVTVPAHAV